MALHQICTRFATCYVLLSFGNTKSEHCSNVIMGAMAFQIIDVSFLYSTVYSGPNQRKHQSSVPLALLGEIRRWPVNFLHKRTVTGKMFQFDIVIMTNLISKGVFSSSTFSATNISSNMIRFLQMHDTIKMNSSHTGINYNHNNIAIINHIMIYNSV